MADMSTIAGVVGLTISTEAGQTIRPKVNDTADYNLGGKDKETLIGATGVAGNRETHTPGMIEVGCFDQRGLSFSDMEDWGTVTVILVTAIGRILSLTGWLVTKPTVSATGGTFTLKFEGVCTELFAS